MSNASQRRAIKNYRRRLTERGMARFEVLGRDADREFIRSFAKRLAEDDPAADRSAGRRQPEALPAEPPQKGRHP